MKPIQSVFLLVLGVALILAPVLAHAIATDHDKARLAEFYQQNPNGALIPSELKPSDHSGYDWACLGIGTAMTLIGIGRSKRCGSTGKPASWSQAEV